MAIQASLGQLFASLDNPEIPWKTIVLYLVTGVWAFETYLSLRQYKVYSYPSPPLSLVQHVDAETYRKSQAYGRDKARFGFVVSAWGVLNSLFVIAYDLMPQVWALSGAVLQRAGLELTEIRQSIVFTLLFSFIRAVLDLPFSYYSAFVVEERHGFNKMTKQTFVVDFVKSLGLGVVFLSPLIAGLIAVIRWAGTDGFVFWVLVFFGVFQVVIQLLYPTVIQPLFNKLTPLSEGPLKSRVYSLASSLRFPLAHIYQIDGSKRSSHSNAYFFGLFPWGNKHIVIFDTLIAKSTCSEIEAVLAHELGHWKHGDPLKLFLLGQLQIGLTFAVFAGFIDNASLFKSFGFDTRPYLPIVIGLELFQLVLSPTDALLKFLSNSAVRSMEYSADAFAARIDRPSFTESQISELRLQAQAGDDDATSNQEAAPGTEKAKGDEKSATPEEQLEVELQQAEQPYDSLLAKALIKLHVQNLSSMHYDGLYSAYHHSHPTLPERLAALEKLRAQRDGAGKKSK
ncbi:unnamed protein product [Parajaminaea phylloscopi]